MLVRLRQLTAWLEAQWRSGALTAALHIQMEVRPYLQAVPYVLAAILVGLVAVIYSAAFSGSVAFVQNVEMKHPYWLLVSSPLCFAFACYLVQRFAPQAAGTGIPQVSRALA